MNVLVILAIFLALVVQADSQSVYNCQRLDDCKQDGVCESDGTCTCTGTLGNYDCSADTALPKCDLQCQNSGTCYTVNSVDTCFCPYGYSGPLCEINNVEITCSANQIDFDLRFPSIFDGVVEVTNGDTPVDAACAMALDDTGTDKVYSITVDISENQDNVAIPCKSNNVETIPGDQADDVVYRISILVTYITGITTTRDEIYYGNCSHVTETVIKQPFVSVAIDNNDLASNEIADDYSPVEMVVLDSSDVLMTSDSMLSVGTEFKLVAYISDNSVYSNITFIGCVTNNTLEGDDAHSFVILDSSCPTQKSKHLTAGQTTSTYSVNSVDLPATELPVEAFMFQSSNKIGILCTVKICKVGDVTCDIPTPDDCENIRNAPGRRKRSVVDVINDVYIRAKRAVGDVSSNMPNEESVSAVLTVQGPNRISDQSKSSSGKQELPATIENCFTRSEIIAVVTVLGSLVCILLIACFIFVCMIIKRRAKMIEVESMSTPLTDRYRIPRAHVNSACETREI